MNWLIGCGIFVVVAMAAAADRSPQTGEPTSRFDPAALSAMDVQIDPGLVESAIAYFDLISRFELRKAAEFLSATAWERTNPEKVQALEQNIQRKAPYDTPTKFIVTTYFNVHPPGFRMLRIKEVVRESSTRVFMISEVVQDLLQGEERKLRIHIWEKSDDGRWKVRSPDGLFF